MGFSWTDDIEQDGLLDIVVEEKPKKQKKTSTAVKSSAPKKTKEEREKEKAAEREQYKKDMEEAMEHQTQLFIKSHRSEKDLLAVMRKEIHGDITILPWREEDGVTGYYFVGLPYSVDYYDLYLLFKDLDFFVTFINIPATFSIKVGEYFGQPKYATQREPLCSWKTINKEYTQEPVPVGRMTSQIEQRLGLGAVIKKVVKDKTSTPLGETNDREKKPQMRIMEFESERGTDIVEVPYFKVQEDLPGSTDSEMRRHMSVNNLDWIIARELGKSQIYHELHRKDILAERD